MSGAGFGDYVNDATMLEWHFPENAAVHTHTQVTSILSTCIILHTAVKSRNVCRDGRLACLAGYVASV